MSKRYGRNQKRAHRERIAQLELRGERMRQVVAERDTEVADLSDHIQYAASVLGHLSILAPNLHHMDGYDGMGLTAAAPLDLLSPMSPTETAMMEIMRCLDIDVVRDAMRQNIHCIIHMAENQVAYALSESTLRKLTRRQLAVLIERRVAPALASLLASELKVKYA